MNLNGTRDEGRRARGGLRGESVHIPNLAPTHNPKLTAEADRFAPIMIRSKIRIRIRIARSFGKKGILR